MHGAAEVPTQYRHPMHEWVRAAREGLADAADPTAASRCAPT